MVPMFDPMIPDTTLLVAISPALAGVVLAFVAIAALVGLFDGRLYLGRLASEWSAQLPPHLRGRWAQQAFD